LFLVAASLANALGAPEENDPSAKPVVQPLPFSHKKHAPLNLKCAECHANSDSGEAMALPTATQCMLCHVAVAKDNPDIQKLASFAKQKRDIPWVRVTKIPDWVFWSHATHRNAGVKCESCHGSVFTMDVLTRGTNVTTMGGCVDCHQTTHAPTGCLACHEGKH
jgi:hypothetical protein